MTVEDKPVHRVSPRFILLCEDDGFDAAIIEKLKSEWGTMEIFEMVADYELTPEEGARMLERPRSWWERVLDWFAGS